MGRGRFTGDQLKEALEQVADELDLPPRRPPRRPGPPAPGRETFEALQGVEAHRQAQIAEARSRALEEANSDSALWGSVVANLDDIIRHAKWAKGNAAKKDAKSLSGDHLTVILGDVRLALAGLEAITGEKANVDLLIQTDNIRQFARKL